MNVLFFSGKADKNADRIEQVRGGKKREGGGGVRVREWKVESLGEK